MRRLCFHRCAAHRRYRTTPSVPRHHGVVEPVVGQALVALDASVAERGVFVAAEREDSLVHLLGVEHLQADEQVEVPYRPPGA